MIFKINSSFFLDMIKIEVNKEITSYCRWDRIKLFFSCVVSSNLKVDK